MGTKMLVPPEVREAASPSNPASGARLIYPKADGLWYSKNSAGVETLLNAAADPVESIWPRVVAGRFYSTDVGVPTTLALVLNTGYFVPFTVPRAVSLGTVNFQVSTASTSGIMRVALFDANSSQQPGTLIHEVATTSTGTTGVKATASFGDALIPGSVYFIGLAPQTSTCTVRSRNSNTQVIGMSAATGLSQQGTGLVTGSASISGAFASTPSVAGGGGPCPTLMLTFT